MATEKVPEAWTTDRIREALIYDGGESEYHDPIHGAQTQRSIAGGIFDRWLAQHDAEVRTDALSSAPEPPTDEPEWKVACPHWEPGRITMRRGCTACAAERDLAYFEREEPTWTRGRGRPMSTENGVKQ